MIAGLEAHIGKDGIDASCPYEAQRSLRPVNKKRRRGIRGALTSQKTTSSWHILLAA